MTPRSAPFTTPLSYSTSNGTARVALKSRHLLPPNSSLPPIPAASEGRCQSQSSNFFDPTIEQDEEDAQSDVPEQSRPSSASSDADFSVLQRHSQAFISAHKPSKSSVNGRRAASQESSTPQATPGDSLQCLLFRAHEACIQAQAALSASKQALEVALRHAQQQPPPPPPSRTADGRLSALTSSSSSDTDTGKRTQLPTHHSDASLITQASEETSACAPGMTSFFDGADEDSEGGSSLPDSAQQTQSLSLPRAGTQVDPQLDNLPTSLGVQAHQSPIVSSSLSSPSSPRPSSSLLQTDPPHSAFSTGSSSSSENDSDRDDASSHMYEHRNDNILEAGILPAESQRPDPGAESSGHDCYSPSSLESTSHGVVPAEPIAGIASTLIDEGQVIPYRLIDPTSEYLLLEDTNERVKIVEIAAPEPVRSNLHSRESMTLRSLERISEEIDLDAEDVRVSRGENESGNARHDTEVPLVRIDSGELLEGGLTGTTMDEEEILQDPPVQVRSRGSPSTPVRHMSIESSKLDQPMAESSTPLGQETPRSTQVLSSLIGDHLHSSSPMSSLPYSAGICPPPTSAAQDGRHSLDSSPTHSAQARRQRLINSLSDSLKVAGVLTDTIRHLEEQVETLQDRTPSPPLDVDTSIKDRLTQSHWSSSTSQFDTSDSGLGFQLRSDLDVMHGVSMDLSGDSLLNVSALEGNIGASNSAASLFGLREQAGEEPPRLISTSTVPDSNEPSPQTDPTSTAFLLPEVPHQRQYTSLSSKSSSGSGETNPHAPSEPSTLSTDDAGSGRAKGANKTQRKAKSKTPSTSTTGSSSAFRSKLSKALFVDRPSRVSKKQLAVDIAQANALDKTASILISPATTASIASPSSGLTAPASPVWRGRKAHKVAITGDKSDARPHADTQSGDGKVGVAVVASSPTVRKSPKLAHRLFDRIRRDSSSSNNNPGAAARTPQLRPRDDLAGCNSPRGATSSPLLQARSTCQPAPRSPSAPPQLDLGANFPATRQDKGKARAISPDNPYAVPSYRGDGNAGERLGHHQVDSIASRSEGGSKSTPSVNERESTSEGDCAEYHTAYSDSVSTLSLPSTEVLKDGHHHRSKTPTPQPHEHVSASSRSSMATITLTPKVSLSELSLHTPPSFPIVAHSRLTRKTTGEETEDENAAREKARKDFQEWLEKQARTRRYW